MHMDGGLVIKTSSHLDIYSRSDLASLTIIGKLLSLVCLALKY